jgi:hypothetical protein
MEARSRAIDWRTCVESWDEEAAANADVVASELAAAAVPAAFDAV